jgi:hypothetical protein
MKRTLDQDLHRLSSALHKYLDSPERKGGKGAITRRINEMGKRYPLDQVRCGCLNVVNELLCEQTENRLGWLVKRLTPGSLYLEGDQVYGWWHDEQLQAEPLPLARIDDSWVVRFTPNLRAQGFVPAHSLPLNGNEVVIWQISQTFELAQYGWAQACPLQWRWDENGLVVERSIINEGWWRAYKYWDGCWIWYLEFHPEWFADMFAPEIEEPLPEPLPSEGLAISEEQAAKLKKLRFL